MPIAYEYDLDNHALLVSGWDHVTLGDAINYYNELAHMPTRLEGCVEYLDFSEVTRFHVCENGALQLASIYEKVLDRGISGVVIHATSEEVRSVVEMLAFTFSEVCGGFQEGYRIARQPVLPRELQAFLRGGSDVGPVPAVKVA
ncbi:MAG: hypothetical protein HKN82_10040 [Akkermansiaceae bacterium]|nr:hypothetical protein [Akkermansiaceae bacterium]NNM28429.1 hypothetical protein [Akkermansiaceae bacterium]